MVVSICISINTLFQCYICSLLLRESIYCRYFCPAPEFAICKIMRYSSHCHFLNQIQTEGIQMQPLTSFKSAEFFRKFRLVCLPFMSVFLAGQVQAGQVSGFLTDKNGQPVQDAVLFAAPINAQVAPFKATDAIVIAQENSAFSPYVSVLRAGTAVRFPNRDPHDHHLKSFSPAKAFELRVKSKRDELAAIVFDKPGEVALVCHFHDWMRGYIYVVDTPYFAKSDAAGIAILNALPAGKYEIKAWAPNMFGEPLSQTVQVNADGASTVKLQFAYVPKAPPSPRKPAKPGPDYNF
jgi:plastocyanin